jgi:hypothetical protein
VTNSQYWREIPYLLHQPPPHPNIKIITGNCYETCIDWQRGLHWDLQVRIWDQRLTSLRGPYRPALKLAENIHTTFTRSVTAAQTFTVVESRSEVRKFVCETTSTVFWDTSLCKGVEVHLRFGGMYCLHTCGLWVCHQAAILRNVGIILPDYTACMSKSSSSSPPKHRYNSTRLYGETSQKKSRLSGNSYCLGAHIYFTNAEPTRVNIARSTCCCSCESSVEI